MSRSSTRSSERKRREVKRLKREEKLLEEKQRAETEKLNAKQRKETIEHRLAIGRAEAAAHDSNDSFGDQVDMTEPTEYYKSQRKYGGGGLGFGMLEDHNCDNFNIASRLRCHGNRTAVDK